MVIAGLFVWVVFLIGAIKFAKTKGRSQLFWLLLVAMMPLSLIVLVLLPPQGQGRPASRGTILSDEPDGFFRRCVHCKTLVDAEDPICTVCGRG
ncbi:hypothetical protein [Sneathiella sp.]|jgi:hypothetical protein|uniref:hypothetical protein n=1 Tax=Sneathiella sp. TaxID=1964365 RepID=UPI0039E29804